MQPLWKPTLAGLLLRIPLGIYFILSGRSKLMNEEAYKDQIKNMNFSAYVPAELHQVVFPEQLEILVGQMYPFLELIVGFLLFIGVMTNVITVIMSIIFVFIVIEVGFINSNNILNHEVIILFSSLALLSTGPGIFSVDIMRHRE